MVGFQKALTLFHKTSKEVPAYRSLLKTQKISSSSIKTKKDFTQLPILDKKNYIYKYQLQDLFPKGNIPAMAYASSGSTGKPTYWFRDTEQEEIAGKLHENIFKDTFHIKKTDSTLVIVCFAMGIWVAGNYTLSSCRYVAKKGYNLTTITPGIEKDDILNTLRDLAPNFQNIILAGYPPFLMDILHETRKQRINLQKNIKILTAGDKFSENWRNDVLELLEIKNVADSIVDIYGSADAGILGYETSLSISIRREAAKDKQLYKELFGNESNIPGLFQYNPIDTFFEEINGELVLTKETAAPLIRYNIRDIGRIIPYQEMKKIVKFKHSNLKFPFLVIKGRSDVAVTFYALNISPEHIQAGVEDRKVARLLSGNFFTYSNTTNRSKTQKLYIKIELAPKIKLTKNSAELIMESINNNLLKQNIEFRKLYSVMGERALPIITINEAGDQNLQSRNKKGVLHIKGKKPKIIL